MNTLAILLVENDPLQRDDLRRGFTGEFCGALVDEIGTESDFVAALEEGRLLRYDLIVMDVMLSWTKVGRRLPMPPEVERGGYYRAGLRNCRRLLESPATRKTPVIVYTALEREDILDDLSGFPRHIAHVRKDGTWDTLMRVASELLNNSSRALI